MDSQQASFAWRPEMFELPINPLGRYAFNLSPSAETTRFDLGSRICVNNQFCTETCRTRVH